MCEGDSPALQLRDASWENREAVRASWIEAFEQELDHFEWDSREYGHYDGSSFAFDVDPTAAYGYKVRVSFYAIDSTVDLEELEPDDEEGHMKCFTLTTDIDMGMEPREFIRHLIHWWICHEADERMFFGPEREQPFFPVHPKTRAEWMEVLDDSA